MDYPRVNIIYDMRRSERYPFLLDELMRQGIINYLIWDAVNLRESTVASINASHKMIVQWAKENGEQEVLIGEDDLMLPNEKGFEYFLKNKPQVYQTYAACNYNSFQRPRNPGVYRDDCQVGFHLYFCHSSYFDEFLATPDDVHIDTEQKGKLMYFCYPFAALQRPGWSFNHKELANYNHNLKPEDIYS